VADVAATETAVNVEVYNETLNALLFTFVCAPGAGPGELCVADRFWVSAGMLLFSGTD